MKKFVSFMLLLCLLLSTFGSVNAQEASVTIKDKTRSYLLGLEVLEEKDLENLSEPMARKDAVKLVINLLGVDVLVASNTVSTFADVPNDSEYVPYIETARQLGLVQGDYSGNFRPDENITIDQYACILVRALGYTGAAESHGGFMTGYNALVNHLRLLKGITPGGNVKANFYIMTENALKENLRSELANGDAIENETLLESIMNRKDRITGEGIVYGNEVYPLDNTVTTDEEHVKIGDSILYKGEMDIEGLLGQKVRYFAKESGGGYKVTFAFTENFNETLCINGKDIAGFDAGTLSYYDEDNDKRKVSIDTVKHYYLVNNRPAASLTLSDLTGKITLIDNDKDNTYEVVSVENSTTHKIIEINSKLGQISLQKEDWYTAGDLLAVSDLIDEDDDREVVILNAAGEKIAFSELKVGDVIDICFSADKKYVRITVNENIIEGKISMIEDNKTLTIGDREYDISASSKGIPAFDNSYLNSEGVFYLNSNNEIVYYKESENTKKYAYIADIGRSGNGISGKVQVKFVFPGGIKYYEKT
ncbi:MAG: S-layer homology domain-containing protein, partial [Clostridia bacterium]|nr:S-layer homology domain-containing protein [Clostridia bacterium]